MAIVIDKSLISTSITDSDFSLSVNEFNTSIVVNSPSETRIITIPLNLSWPINSEIRILVQKGSFVPVIKAETGVTLNGELAITNYPKYAVAREYDVMIIRKIAENEFITANDEDVSQPSINLFFDSSTDLDGTDLIDDDFTVTSPDASKIVYFNKDGELQDGTTDKPIFYFDQVEGCYRLVSVFENRQYASDILDLTTSTWTANSTGIQTPVANAAALAGTTYQFFEVGDDSTNGEHRLSQVIAAAKIGVSRKTFSFFVASRSEDITNLGVRLARAIPVSSQGDMKALFDIKNGTRKTFTGLASGNEAPNNRAGIFLAKPAEGGNPAIYEIFVTIDNVGSGDVTLSLYLTDDAATPQASYQGASDRTFLIVLPNVTNRVTPNTTKINVEVNNVVTSGGQTELRSTVMEYATVGANFLQNRKGAFFLNFRSNEADKDESISFTEFFSIYYNSGTTNDNAIQVGFDNDDEITLIVSLAGVDTEGKYLPVVSKNTDILLAVSYEDDNVSMAVNGTLAFTLNNVEIAATLDTIALGMLPGVDGVGETFFKEIRVYDHTLSPETLIALTSV